MTRLVLAVAVLALSLASSGCATLLTGSSAEEARITATPAGATYEVTPPTASGGSGTTPRDVYLERTKDYSVTVSAPGYRARTVQVQRKVNPWFYASLACGLLGGISDAITGSMWCHETRIDVVLMRESAGPAPVAASAPPAVPAARPVERERRGDAFEEVSAKAKFCSGCGTKLKAEDAFCAACGRRQ